jgi:hypothetical protein
MMNKPVDRNYKLNTLDTVALEIFKGMASSSGFKVSIGDNLGEQQIQTARLLAKTFLRVAEADTGYE